MYRWFTITIRQLSLVFVLVATGGCTGTTGSAPDAASVAKPTSTLAAGEHVELLEEVGEFARIEDGTGEQRYVPLGLLKHRNTAEAAEDESLTHTVVRDAPTYTELPTVKPATLEPRSIAQITAEQLSLNGLFLSETSGKEVIAPRNVPRFVIDQATGERCWHVYECIHPECPGEATGGRAHFIFIQPQSDWKEAIQCPACAKVRDLATETPEQWQQWGQFVRAYELPETVRRRAQLDSERRRAVEAKRSRVR